MRTDREEKGRGTTETTLKIIKLSYLPLLLAFLILWLLKLSGIFSLPLRYDILAYLLVALAVPALIHSASHSGRESPFIRIILVCAFLFALCTRLLPLIQNSIPSGYDTGFYKYTMELYYNFLPQIPETELASWIKQMFEQGLFVLSDALHLLAGASALDQINFLFPFLAAFLVFPLFIVTRNLFGPAAAAIASLLYSVSYTQYTAFTLLYFKNIIGMIFLLLAIYALEKRKDGLMALMFAALGIFHRPEFLLFALILIPYFILHRRRGIPLAVLAAAVLIAPFWIPRWQDYWSVISAGVGAGTFFGLDTYTLVSLAYLPFALLGAVYLVINRKWNSILFYFAITFIIVIFQVFFFKRYIIMFDLAVVILAAAGIVHILLQKKEIWRLAGLTAVLLVLVISGRPTLLQANELRSGIKQEPFAALEWIKENAEYDACVLAASSDAPWVLGWGGRRVIAPGLFDWQLQSKEVWIGFLDSKDPEAARKFLDFYHSPVYIFFTKNSSDDLGMEKFKSGYFQEVYVDSQAVVLKYPGGG